MHLCDGLPAASCQLLCRWGRGLFSLCGRIAQVAGCLLPTPGPPACLPACLPARHTPLPSPSPACSEAALAWLGADVAVFVGDFGEEAVQVRGCCRCCLLVGPRRALGPCSTLLRIDRRQRLEPSCAFLVLALSAASPATSPRLPQLVERIAALPLPKVVCLGNHDAW